MAGIPSGNNVPSGGNVLSSSGNVITGNNVPATSSQSPVPPGSPGLWYDAQDINFGGAQPADGTTISAWKNKGTLGATWDLAQATGAARPTFVQTATPGKINNLSSVKATGTQWMATSVLSAQPLASTCAIMVRHDSTAASIFIYDGQTGGREGINTFTGGILQISGAGTFNTTKTVSAATWDSIVTTYGSGATSSLRLDGVASTAGNCTPGGITGVTIFAFVGGGGGLMTGQLAEILWYWDATTGAQIESYFAAKYGTTPQ